LWSGHHVQDSVSHTLDGQHVSHESHDVTGHDSHVLDAFWSLPPTRSMSSARYEHPETALKQAAAFLQGPSDEPSVQGVHSAVQMNFMHPSSSSASSFLSKQSMAEFIHGMPAVALIPLHAASIVTSLPGHIAFELGEGYLFGFKKGFALAFIGKSLGSATAFAVGRNAGCLGGMRQSIKDKLKDWPTARKAAKGVERGGHSSVFLVRIAPLPCLVKNYALSLLTDIPWTKFLPGTLLGLLPTTAAHVYAGTLAPSLAEMMSGQGAAMKVVAAAGTVGGVTFASLLAAYLLHQQSNDEDAEEVEDADKEEEPQLIIRHDSAAVADEEAPPPRPATVKLFRKPELAERPPNKSQKHQ